jgi:hypothetical protein
VRDLIPGNCGFKGIIVRSSHRQCFNFRTCFQVIVFYVFLFLCTCLCVMRVIVFKIFPVDPNTCLHSLVPVVHFELCAVRWRMCCVLFSSFVISVVFLHWGKEHVNSRTN